MKNHVSKNESDTEGKGSGAWEWERVRKSSEAIERWEVEGLH